MPRTHASDSNSQRWDRLQRNWRLPQIEPPGPWPE